MTSSVTMFIAHSVQKRLRIHLYVKPECGVHTSCNPASRQDGTYIICPTTAYF